jgi:predicted MFS family arabinose efflux permease
MESRAYRDEPGLNPTSTRNLFRIRAFAVLYGAETLSIAGDQLARVALSVLVFQRTDSATATALTYAATFLPAILGGALLARVGDRLSRRTVMVSCDLVRAALFAAMAVPGLPLPIVVALLIAAVFLGPAFSASEVGYLAAALDPDQFRAATGLRMVTNQIAQVAGFAVGGVLVAALLPRGALLVDACTYALSAVVIRLALRPSGRRQAPQVGTPDDAGGAAFPGLLRHPRLRALMALSALAGFFIVPEGLTVPFASEVGATTTEAGLLLAAIPLGGAVGAVLLVRLVPKHRRSWVAGAMAIGCGLPLIVTAFEPIWPIAWLCWFASGGLAAFQVEATTSIVQAIPDRLRARLLGLASSWLIGAQGVGLLLFGAIANVADAGRSIAVAGVVGTALATFIVLGPLRASQHRAAHSAPDTAESGVAGMAAYVGRHAGAARPDVAVLFVECDPGTSTPTGRGSGSGAKEIAAEDSAKIERAFTPDK